MKVAVRSMSLVLIPILLGTSACENASTPTEPIERITVSFEGTLAPSGSEFNHFIVGRPGVVTVTVFQVLGVETSTQATVGLAIGTSDGTRCTLVAKNENATLGTVMSGSALAGGYCVNLYDVGKLVETINYSLQVGHP